MLAPLFKTQFPNKNTRPTISRTKPTSTKKLNSKSGSDRKRKKRGSMAPPARTKVTTEPTSMIIIKRISTTTMSTAKMLTRIRFAKASPTPGTERRRHPSITATRRTLIN